MPCILPDGVGRGVHISMGVYPYHAEAALGAAILSPAMVAPEVLCRPPKLRGNNPDFTVSQTVLETRSYMV